MYGSMDAEEPPHTQCGENRVHVTGISPSFGRLPIWLVNGEVVQPSLTVRDLRVIIDPVISFVDYVARLGKPCYFQIR